MAQILSFATVLFALCLKVGINWTFFTGLENDAEDLFACPQGHGLLDRERGRVSFGSQPTYVRSLPL